MASWLVCVFSAWVCGHATPVSISLGLGSVIGLHEDGADHFQGIRYARAKRFERPVQEVLAPSKAMRLGPECLQPAYGPGNLGSEDCLFLNVYTPSNSSNSSSLLPVYVWVHGGGFSVGSGGIYRGSGLAVERGVVVVTLNYRLGPFGFFVGDLGDGGGGENANLGLFDQQMAFRWVKTNIHLFGGDPQDVTVFGQSAGGSSVALQVIASAGMDLFHGVIAQSPFYAVSPLAQGRRTSRALMTRLNCSDVKCIKRASAEDVMRASNPQEPVLDYLQAYQDCRAGLPPPGASSAAVCRDLCSAINQDCSTTGLPFGPVFGPGTNLPSNPLVAFAQGVGSERLRRVVAGTVLNEGPDLMLLPPFTIDQWLNGINASTFNETFLPGFADMLQSYGLSGGRFSKGQRARIAKLYFPPSRSYPPDSSPWRQVAFEMFKDAVYVCPSFVFLEGASRKLPNDTFAYRFDHVRKCKLAPGPGNHEYEREFVSHGSELPFLFRDPYLDRLACPDNDTQQVAMPFDRADADIGRALRAAFTKHGSPSESPSESGVPPDWLPWKTSAESPTLLYFTNSTAASAQVSSLQMEACAFWSHLYQAVALKPDSVRNSTTKADWKLLWSEKKQKGGR